MKSIIALITVATLISAQAQNVKASFSKLDLTEAAAAIDNEIKRTELVMLKLLIEYKSLPEKDQYVKESVESAKIAADSRKETLKEEQLVEIEKASEKRYNQIIARINRELASNNAIVDRLNAAATSILGK